MSVSKCSSWIKIYIPFLYRQLAFSDDDDTKVDMFISSLDNFFGCTIDSLLVFEAAQTEDGRYK